MNNKEGYELLKSQPSIKASSEEFIRMFDLPESDIHIIRAKFRQLKFTRDSYLKQNDLATWEEMLFYSFTIEQPAKKRSIEKTIIEVDLEAERRKPLSQLS